MDGIKTPQHIHKVIELECLIESKVPNKTNRTKIKLPSTDDWNQNLQSILARIPHKFPIISHMHDTAWCLALNDDQNTIIQSDDPTAFGELLSSTEPPLIIQIICNKNYSVALIPYAEKAMNVFFLEYNDESFKWEPTTIDWNLNYHKLIEDINTRYKLHQNEYILCDSDECYIECGADLSAIWQLLKNDDSISIAAISIKLNDETEPLKSKPLKNIMDPTLSCIGMKSDSVSERIEAFLSQLRSVKRNSKDGKKLPDDCYTQQHFVSAMNDHGIAFDEGEVEGIVQQILDIELTLDHAVTLISASSFKEFVEKREPIGSPFVKRFWKLIHDDTDIFTRFMNTWNESDAL